MKLWITINEPYVVSWVGYGLGILAPGVKKPETGAYDVAHNLIKAHAEVWHTYDKEYRSKQKGELCCGGTWTEVGEQLGCTSISPVATEQN